MTRTPDEIKRGLECCAASYADCHKECPYKLDCDGSQILKDALVLIQQLERDKTWAGETSDMLSEENKRLEERAHQLDVLNLGLLVEKAQLEAERDAAVRDIEESQPCFACKHFNRNSGNCGGGKRCLRLAEIAERNGGTYQGKFFKWRGVQKEE